MDESFALDRTGRTCRRLSSFGDLGRNGGYGAGGPPCSSSPLLGDWVSLGRLDLWTSRDLLGLLSVSGCGSVFQEKVALVVPRLCLLWGLGGRLLTLLGADEQQAFLLPGGSGLVVAKGCFGVSCEVAGSDAVTRWGVQRRLSLWRR